MPINPYERYRRQDLETCNQQELVGRLFNEAALCLRRACADIEKKQFSTANEAIKKAEVIVNTLNSSLDMQYSISKLLRSLYQYMNRRMLEANFKKDPAILSEIAGILTELRDAWNEAIHRSRKLQANG